MKQIYLLSVILFLLVSQSLVTSYKLHNDSRLNSNSKVSESNKLLVTKSQGKSKLKMVNTPTKDVAKPNASESKASNLSFHPPTKEAVKEVLSHSSNSLDPDACGRSIGKTKQKQVFLPNPDLEFLTKEQITEITKFKECEIKSGLIYMLEKSKSYEKELTLVLIYLKTDASMMRFYQSLNPKSEFHEIPMKGFIKIGRKFDNTSCFEILMSKDPEPSNPKDTKNKRGDLTLCTLNVRDEHDWVRDLFRMKECTNGGKNLLADFGGINSYIAKLKTKPNIKTPIQKTGMYYATDGVYDEYPPLTQKQGFSTYSKTISNVGKAIENIHNTIKKETIKKKKIEKKLVKKLEEVKKTAKMIKKKKDIMQTLLQSRWETEKKKKEQLIAFEHDNRAVKLLDKVNKEIKKVKVIIFYPLYTYFF